MLAAMAHLDLVPKKDVSSFRKIAIGTWRTTYDPSVYGTMELRMEKAVKYIEAFRARTGRHSDATHSDIGRPVSSSIAYQGLPSCRPPSTMRTTPGCRSRVSVITSDRIPAISDGIATRTVFSAAGSPVTACSAR